MRDNNVGPSSTLQRKLVTQQTFKRNQRYLDLSSMKMFDDGYSVDRRKPFTGQSTSRSDALKSKLNNSFTSTTACMTDRLATDIDKFKSRVRSKSMQFAQAKSQSTKKSGKIDNRYTTLDSTVCCSPKQIRGVPMSKQTSRQYYHNLRNKPCNDQRLFNNFELIKPKTHRSHSFQKDLGKNLDSAHHHMTDLEFNTQQLYQDYYYKRTSMKCRVNYKIENKEEGRMFFIAKHQSDKPATDLDSKKIKQCYEKTIVCHIAPSDQFYGNSGRQLPHQQELRAMTPLVDYWHGQDGQISRPSLDFAQRKMKNDLRQQRIQNIKKKRERYFQRNQLCDQKYFQIMGFGRQNNSK